LTKKLKQTAALPQIPTANTVLKDFTVEVISKVIQKMAKMPFAKSCKG
jgi:hypothetical protein